MQRGEMFGPSSLLASYGSEPRPEAGCSRRESARWAGVVRGRDHDPTLIMTGILGDGPRSPLPSTTKCDSLRQATHTS